MQAEVGMAIESMPMDVYKQPRTELTDEEKRRQARGEDLGLSSFAAHVKLRAKHIVVVGTGHLRGEDANCRGRLLMFEVSRQQMDSYASFQVQLVAEKEIKGPALTLAPMQGYVAVGVGPKVELYKLVEDEIVCICFILLFYFNYETIPPSGRHAKKHWASLLERKKQKHDIARQRF